LSMGFEAPLRIIIAVELEERLGGDGSWR
jgi:hypothetical protein